MPDMEKAKQFSFEGYCPEQDKKYSIIVHGVPENGEWRIFGFTCDHKIKNHHKCTQMLCPIIPRQIDEPLP